VILKHRCSSPPGVLINSAFSLTHLQIGKWRTEGHGNPINPNQLKLSMGNNLTTQHTSALKYTELSAPELEIILQEGKLQLKIRLEITFVRQPGIFLFRKVNFN